MVQKLQARQTRQPSAATAHRVGSFKPIAIPAVAAAVSAGAGRPARQAERREDLPAILRQDDFVD
jgi:hypothetical protein